MRLEVVGIPEIQKRLMDISRGLSDDTAANVYLGAAQAMSKRAKELAPLGNHPAYGGASKKYPAKAPGTLRKAIIARKFKPAAIQKYGPGAFAQVNLKVEYKNQAYYGHIVEGGRKAISEIGKGRPTGGHAKWFTWLANTGGEWVFKKKVKGFTGRRFFARAVSQMGAPELEKAAAKMQQVLKTKYGL